MKNYIEIAGKRYRVANNWNATVLYSEIKGIEDLGGLDDLSKLKPRDLTTMMRCCLIAGEELDEKDFDLSENQLAGFMNGVAIGKFLQIFKRQANDGLSAEEIKERDKEFASKKK